MAHQKLNEEMNVIELIKMQRYFAKALRSLLTAGQRFELREQTRYLIIDPATSDEEEEPGRAEKQSSGKRYEVDKRAANELSAGHFTSSSSNSSSLAVSDDVPEGNNFVLKPSATL